MMKTKKFIDKVRSLHPYILDEKGLTLKRTSPQSQHQMQGRILLNAVIRQGSSIL